MDLSLPASLKIFNRLVKTIVFNTIKHEESENLVYYQVTHDVNLVHQIMNALYQMKIISVLVEGGARLLQSFIDENIWDEIRTIGNKQLAIGKGLPAPVFTNAERIDEQEILSDKIEIFKNQTLPGS
jgi:diaminohydroxyphosphoribosylaminopyrimidine deaminase/5-amino-6-(5-phosphoribosylamino)uracil reductase